MSSHDSRNIPKIVDLQKERKIQEISQILMSEDYDFVSGLAFSLLLRQRLKLHHSENSKTALFGH